MPYVPLPAYLFPMKHRRTSRGRAALSEVPYEALGRSWAAQLRGYRDMLHFALPMADRSAWARRIPGEGFRVFSCGWYVEAHRHFWEREALDEGVYIYCTAGRGFYRCGGREWTISSGDLLYCPPMTHHAYGADERAPWTIFWMHVSGSGVPAWAHQFGFSPSRPVLHVGIRPRVIAAFRTLFHFMKSPLTEARAAAISHSAQLALACLAVESGEEVATEAIGAGVQCVTDYMEKHVDEPADLPAWLKLFGGSRSHFQRQFKRATGHAPLDYFLRLKIRKACGLLSVTGLRIGEIADRIGMADPYYFSRQFRRVTGTSPRAYRARIAQHDAATL